MRISDWSSDVSSSDLWATAGVLAANGGDDAPYFTCLALAGRPEEQLHNLLRGFTDLVEKYCGCERGRVRGQGISIEPKDWSIGGEPASAVRTGEARSEERRGGQRCGIPCKYRCRHNN